MKKQNETNTVSGMQEELRYLLTCADDLLRLFGARAAIARAEGANRFTAGGMGGREEGRR